MSSIIGSAWSHWKFYASRFFNQMLGVGTTLDVAKECRRNTQLTEFDFFRWYISDPIANRVVGAYPDFTWAEMPKIESDGDATESEFDRQIAVIAKEKGLLAALHSADVQAGIGEFGLLVVLFEDDTDLSKPLDFKKGRKVSGFRAYSQNEIQITKTLKSPAWKAGFPEEYRIGPRAAPAGLATAMPATLTTAADQQNTVVHHSRCVHVVDGIISGGLVAIPRLLPVAGPIQDIQKILGGSAHAMWRTGFPEYSLEFDPELAEIDLEDEDTVKGLKDKFQDFMDAVERIMTIKGGALKTHNASPQSPKDAFDVQLTAIAIQTKIPLRILTGADDGKLAGDQAKGIFRINITARQVRVAEPGLLRPLISILIASGALADPGEDGYSVKWGDMENMTRAERADLIARLTDALAKFSLSSANSEFTFENYLRYVWELPEEIIAKLTKDAEDMTPPDVPEGGALIPQDGQPVEASGMATKGKPVDGNVARV